MLLIRELGVPLVTGDIPGVAVILGSAPSVEEGVALVKSYQAQGILVTLVGGICRPGCRSWHEHRS